MKNSVLVIIGVLLGACAAGHGYPIDQVDVQYWAGSGSSRSVMVVDFGAGANYAFGYRWDGSATSWDMLKTVCEASGSTVTVGGRTISGTGGTMEIAGTDYGWGKIIESIRYGGRQLVDDYYGSRVSIRYWISGHSEYVETLYDDQWNPIGSVTHPAAAGDGQSWISPPFGITSRTLDDGFWDGYTQADAAGQADQPTVPLEQVGNPIPEPATVGLVALAWSAVLLRCRRRLAQATRGMRGGRDPGDAMPERVSR